MWGTRLDAAQDVRSQTSGSAEEPTSRQKSEGLAIPPHEGLSSQQTGCWEGRGSTLGTLPGRGGQGLDIWFGRGRGKLPSKQRDCCGEPVAVSKHRECLGT